MAGKTHSSAEHEHFPWKHVVGFILSIVLTILAFWIAIGAEIGSSAKLWIIFGFAFIQAFLQLFMVSTWQRVRTGLFKSEILCLVCSVRSFSSSGLFGSSRLTTATERTAKTVIHHLRQSSLSIQRNNKKPLIFHRWVVFIMMVITLPIVGRYLSAAESFANEWKSVDEERCNVSQNHVNGKECDHEGMSCWR